jgi:hypothetical protein
MTNKSLPPQRSDIVAAPKKRQLISVACAGRANHPLPAQPYIGQNMGDKPRLRGEREE